MELCKSTFIADMSRSPYVKLRPVPIENVHLEDSFWAPRQRILREVTLPTQHQMLEETGRLFNFRRAAGKEKGNFKGLFFNDSDVYKWIEAIAFLLASTPDQELLKMVHQVIPLISTAQDKDGYLNTYFTHERKNERWTNLRDMHELYCAGHLIQAAIAYYRATGEHELLDIACRVADHIAGIFSYGKRSGTPGHPEVEMALIELYRTTGKDEYLNLSRFFVDNRGKGAIGGSPYHIDHKPFRELTEIVGHAVRSIYLNCGIADVYMETGEKALLDELKWLWHIMTERKMYVTGGVGARYEGESFGDDYELPNARAYAETCAAIASVMWNWRMLLISGEGRFADVIELAFYNGVLSGISLDGKEYFYVNPLADRGKHRRQRWFECACCPPNVARLLASLPGYFYSTSPEGIWVHLYAQSTSCLNIMGNSVTIVQHTNYPWNGEIEIVLYTNKEATFSLFLRIPGWCQKVEALVNSEVVKGIIQQGRYLEIRRVWKPGDRLQLSFYMPAERIISHPYVMENTDRVALRRGPLIYCVEQTDNPDCDVWNLMLPSDSSLKVKWVSDLLNGVMVIQSEALAIDTAEFKNQLYQLATNHLPKVHPVRFTAVPYYAWANRESGPMTVWIRSLAYSLNFR